MDFAEQFITNTVDVPWLRIRCDKVDLDKAHTLILDMRNGRLFEDEILAAGS